MVMRLSTAATNAALVALAAEFTGNSIIKIYDDEAGGIPTDVDAAVVGKELVTVNLVGPVFPAPIAVANGLQVQANNLPLSGTAIDNGTATYFRAFNDISEVRVQGDVGISGPSPPPDLILATTSVSSGIDVEILSWFITLHKFDQTPNPP